MPSASLIGEYLDNTRELLRQKPHLFGLMVERQIQVRLLPQAVGPRKRLEPQLWMLLSFCLDGPEAATPTMDAAAMERAAAASENGTSLDGARPASFPTAARAVAAVMRSLHEYGVHPPPKLR